MRKHKLFFVAGTCTTFVLLPTDVLSQSFRRLAGIGDFAGSGFLQGGAVLIRHLAWDVGLFQLLAAFLALITTAVLFADWLAPLPELED